MDNNKQSFNSKDNKIRYTRIINAENMLELLTTVKVAADWASDSSSDWASDWASHSTVFNHSKVDYLNPFFWLLLRYFLL